MLCVFDATAHLRRIVGSWELFLFPTNSVLTRMEDLASVNVCIVLRVQSLKPLDGMTDVPT